MKAYTPPRDTNHRPRCARNSPGDEVTYVKNGWEHFSHGSDVGLRGIGSTLEEAFEQAAIALTAVVADVSSVQEKKAVEVCCEAPDIELLFVNWLNTVIYEMAVRRMLFRRFRVELQGCVLKGILAGERVDPERHQVAVEAKGATVTSLRVERTPDGQWIAQCVVDV